MFLIILQTICLLLILSITSYLYIRILVIEIYIKWIFKHSLISSELSVLLKNLILNSLDENIFPIINSDGLKGIDLKYQDKTDSYHNLDDLIKWLARFKKLETINQSDELIKALYQLQYTLLLSTSSINRAINVIMLDLQDMKVLTDTISTIKIINAGELVDRNTMIPLTYGSRVQQPLGVICFNANGKVINKAKVLCI